MTRLWLVGALAIALLPRPADACAIKDNDVAIVVGTVGTDVATLRIALHEQERPGELMDGEWSGAATLVIGAQTISIGRIDPKKNPDLEIDRLTTLAHDRAKKLAGFVAAAQIEQTDCADAPNDRCGIASLTGNKLHVGTTATLVGDDVRITGVVRYRAGETEIAVVNVGVGSARFPSSVKPCNPQGCRLITTLHHGDQKDIVVVTRRGA